MDESSRLYGPITGTQCLMNTQSVSITFIGMHESNEWMTVEEKT